MEKRTLGFFASFFAVVAIVALAFNVVTAPGNQPPLSVNVENTPLPVEVTNPSSMPIATNCTTVYAREVYVGDFHVMGMAYDAKVVHDLGGKTVVFTGGGVSGGIAFSSDYGLGGSPGLGRVRVMTTEVEWTYFALPLNSMLRIEDVDEIWVEAWANFPRLRGGGQLTDVSYYATVIATVNWYIEDG